MGVRRDAARHDASRIRRLIADANLPDRVSARWTVGERHKNPTQKADMCDGSRIERIEKDEVVGRIVEASS